MAESREVRAIRQYLADSGLSHRVTSTLRKPRFPGDNSRHIQGLAVDFAGPGPDQDGSPEMLAIFEAFVSVEGQLHELIYSGAPYSIKAGKRTKVAYGDADVLRAHWNHVHVSVGRGTLVRWPSTPATVQLPQNGPVRDYEEAQVRSQLMFIGPLDDQGNGWSDWQLALGRDPIVVGAVLQGPSPPDDGNYWSDQAKVNISAQPRGGVVRVVVRGGKPGDTVGVYVSCA